MDFFRNIPSPPAFPRPSSGRVDEARAPSFLVDVAGLSLVIAWTFVFWNGDGVGMAAAVCGSVDLLLALQSGATALFSALIAISLYARKRRLFLLLCGASAFAACVALPCFAVWVDGGRAEAISIAFFLSGAGSTVRLGWESSMFGRGPFQAAILAAASYGMGFLIFVGICAVPRGSVAIGSFLPALSLALFVAFRLRNLACRNLPDSSGAARFASPARPAHPSSPLGMPSRRASRLFGALGLVFFAYGIMRSSGVAEGIPTSGGAFAAALPALGSCCAVLCASFAFRRRPFAIVYASSLILAFVAVLPSDVLPLGNVVLFCCALVAADSVKYIVWLSFACVFEGLPQRMLLPLALARSSQWLGSFVGQAAFLVVPSKGLAVLVSVVAVLVCLIDAMVPAAPPFSPPLGKEDGKARVDASREERPSCAEAGREEGFFSSLNLTPREREVCSLWVRGHTAAHIERRLCVSKSTVKTHVSHIYEKAGVSSREELIAAFEEFAPSRSR